jgi:NAD(P)H-hydrate epimerase
MTLPVALHTAAAVRALEARALAMHGVDGADGAVLMRRAAAAALAALRAGWPRARDIVVLCGGGNNGGDGWMLAGLARAAGLSPQVLWTTPPDTLRGEAAQAAAEALAAGVPASAFDATGAGSAQLAEADVIVDALLGLGLTQAVRPPIAAAIAAINAAGRPVLALDLPSGLCADSGRVQGDAVHADVTITFIVLKAGLRLGAVPDHAGQVRLDTLGIVDDLGPPAWTLLDAARVRSAIPARRRDAHKGQGGHVFVVGGGPGMPGAARLAGEAALRVGAGRVTVACAADSAVAIAAGRPELMVRGLSAAPDAAAQQLRAALAGADVLVVGPGLGRDAWAQAVLAAALDAAKPTVVDADALHLLHEVGATAQVAPPRASRIYTPHPGEAAQLLGLTAAAVQADRPAALAALVARLGGVVVLKGAGTLLATSGSVPAVCDRGDPVLAAPGTGDVLAGAIAGLLAQSGDAARDASGDAATVAFEAACAAVWLHARAGERSTNAASRGVLAGEIAARLTDALAEVMGGVQR